MKRELQLTFSPDIRSLIDRIFSLNITVPPFLERSIIKSEGMTQGTTVLNDAKGIHMDVSTKGVHIQLSAEALQYFENHQPDFDEEAAKESQAAAESDSDDEPKKKSKKSKKDDDDDDDDDVKEAKYEEKE